MYTYIHVYAHTYDYRNSIIPCTGVHPHVHGRPEPPHDMELQLLKAGVHVFIEKPVSLVPPAEFLPYVAAVEAVRKEKQLVVSVGYMFRHVLLLFNLYSVDRLMLSEAHNTVLYLNVCEYLFFAIFVTGEKITKLSTCNYLIMCHEYMNT